MVYLYPRFYNCSVPAAFLADLPQLAQLCEGSKPPLASDKRVEQLFSMQGEKFVSFVKSERYVDGKIFLAYCGSFIFSFFYTCSFAAVKINKYIQIQYKYILQQKHYFGETMEFHNHFWHLTIYSIENLPAKLQFLHNLTFLQKLLSATVLFAHFTCLPQSLIIRCRHTIILEPWSVWAHPTQVLRSTRLPMFFTCNLLQWGRALLVNLFTF